MILGLKLLKLSVINILKYITLKYINKYKNMLTKWINKEYINSEINEEIIEKGFKVYEYITVKELLLTVKQDYIKAISFIHIPFFILTLIIWFITFSWEVYMLFVYYLLLVYTLIFTYILFKLFKNTYRFFKISHVIYTNSWILINEEFFKYNDDKQLVIKLFKYKHYFQEYLSEPSNLRDAIAEEEWYLFKKVLSSSWKALQFALKSNISTSYFRKKDKNIGFAFGTVLITGIYIASIYISYYLGLILWVLFFWIYTFFIKIYKSFNPSHEEKIKNIFRSIDIDLYSALVIQELINTKISSFESWKIENISKFIFKKFWLFYSKIKSSRANIDLLYSKLDKYWYNKFLDKKILNNYIKKEFNNPINLMIDLLETYILDIEKQKKEILRLIKNTDNKQILVKDKNLDLINNAILNNIKSLKEWRI